jgi:hypothetical protein
MVKVQQKIAGTFRSEAEHYGFLPDSQLPGHDAQARPSHAGCASGNLCWLPLPIAWEL